MDILTMVRLPEVRNAQDILMDIVHQISVLTSRYLSERSRASVFLSCENVQRTGAFKFRRAYDSVSRLNSHQRTKPIIALSSGNHAQGVALACQFYGLDAHIVMPEPVNPVKAAAVQGYGGTVHQVVMRADGEQFVQDLVTRMNGHLTHAVTDPHVIAWQGTATLELLDEHPDLDVLLAPVAGGGSYPAYASQRMARTPL